MTVINLDQKELSLNMFSLGNCNWLLGTLSMGIFYYAIPKKVEILF